MIRKLFAGLLVCGLLGACASAEVYTGVTAAHSTVAVTNSAEQAPEKVNVTVGQKVAEGDVLAQQRITKVFSAQDGIVARVFKEEGDTVDGDVIELTPVSKYTVYCSVEEAYSSAENQTVHCGETVYISCTKNGTHRAVARIYSIDGETYMAETTGGELYVGETVYIYRDTTFSSSAKIGIGTVVESDTEKYSSTGCIEQIFVQEGDCVERGQLLYTIAPNGGAEITAPVGGIIYSVNENAAGNGDQTLAVIVPEDEICVEITVDENAIGNIHIGDAAEMIYTNDIDETVVSGTVMEISRISGDDGYLVTIKPESAPEYIGLSARVYVGE